MKSIQIVLGFLLFISCSSDNSTAQSKDMIETSNPETNIIDLPEWIGDNELETIRKIEAQDSIDYSDYIQLAISYAQIDSDSTIISTLVEKALNANTTEACKSLVHILDHQSKWKITSQYKDVVNSKLLSFNCDE